MKRTLSALIRCKGGNSAAEMALVTPLLLTLMFGSFELGNYFLSEHVVVVAVRDGARYAGRRPFADYSCAAPTTAARDATRNVTRTGQVDTGGTARLINWTDATTITVSVSCDTTVPGSGGIFTGLGGGARIVTVQATLPYRSLFQSIGLGTLGLNLSARSQAAVMGV